MKPGKPEQLQNLTALPEEFQDTALTFVEQLNNLIGNLKAVYTNVKEINAKEVVNAWLLSPTHQSVILDDEYNKIGCYEKNLIYVCHFSK